MWGGKSSLVRKAEGPTRSDILLQAQRAREERDQQRKLGHHVVLIQRMARRTIARQRVLTQMREEVDRRLADIKKLAQWLEAAQGVKGFTPPVDTSVRLCREFVLSYRRRRRPRPESGTPAVASPGAGLAGRGAEEAGQAETKGEGGEAGQHQRLQRLCAVLLLRSLHHPKDAKLSILLTVAENPGLHGYWWRRLVANLIDSLQDTDYRQLAVRREPPPPSLAVLSLLIQHHALTASTLTLCGPLLCPPLFETIRHVCLTQNPAFTEPQRLRRPIKPDAALAPLYTLAMHLLTATLPSPPPLEAYARLLLSLPLFLALSPVDHTPLLPHLFPLLHDLLPHLPSSLALDAYLPPSPCPAGSSALWLTANLCALLASHVHGRSRAQLLPLLAPAAPMPCSLTPQGGSKWRRPEGLLPPKAIEEECVLEAALRVVADLLAHVPPAVMSDREVIRFEKDGTHIKTLVVSSGVVEQLQSLVREDVLRRLSNMAFAGFNPVQLHGGATPSELREIENAQRVSTLQLMDASHKHRTNRDAKWFGARWASSLVAKIGSLAMASASGRSNEGEHQDVDESAENEEGAASPDLTGPSPCSATSGAPPEGVLQAYAAFLGVVLWKGHSAAAASYGFSANNVWVAILNTLAFSTPALPRLYAYVTANVKAEGSRALSPLGSSFSSHASLASSLGVLCSAYSHVLMILDDHEMHEDGVPLPLHHVLRLLRLCKPVLLAGCRAEASGELVMAPQRAITTSDVTRGGAAAEGADIGIQQDADFGAFLHRSVASLLRALYDRWSRRAFCSPETWVMEGMEDWRLRREVMNQTLLGNTLLRVAPYCVPLPDRMVIYNAQLTAERERCQPQDLPNIAVKIRRAYVLHDAMHMLGQIGERLKSRIVVIYYSELGVQEQGIDAGGLFKDFWTDLSGMVFDLEFGLFMRTPEGLLYPNPASVFIHGVEHLRLFEFVGRILGKAMFEGITVSPVFAHFFLGFIRGGYNFMNAVNDLESLDPELYKNLVFLRTYEGGVGDLGLSFTVVDEDMGKNIEVELIENGANTAVTSENKFRYIGLVAKHHMYDRLKMQSEAFVRGFREVLDPVFLQMFNEPELQILISGSPSGIDVEDMRAHTHYTGGFIAADWHIRRFWRIVSAFTPTEQSALLRFVTGCPRPPPLGFRGLQPPFTLHRVSITRDDKLPAASTCFNVLKLPTYSSEAVMRDKLLTAIFSGSGFELA